VDDGGSQGGQQFSLTASKGAKGVGSRTAILDGKTIWSEDDKIYVSSEDGRVTGVLKLDPNSLSEDKTTATFTGFVFGDPAKLAYSVFPAPTNGNIIDLSTIEGGKEVDAPFIGRINTNDDVDVRFDHVCGVAPIVKNNYQGGDIVINATNNSSAVTFLKELDVTKVDLTKDKPEFIVDNASNKTSTITITSPKGGEMYVPYYITSTPEANNDGKKVVEFKHGNDVVNNADLTDGFVGKVHATTVVVYTMDENGKSVENKTTESTLSADEKTALVDQNQFSSINSNESATSEETQYFNVSGLVEKTEEGKTQNVVAEAVEVTLPKVEVSEGNEDVVKSVEISFTNVTSSTTITIQEEESTSGSESNKSIDNLTVVLPSGTTAEEAKEAININMPNTTVTVKSDDGQILLIENMTAATADNTLVVGADVEIKSLTIKKGKVQVFGKVGEIKRDGQNKDDETVVTIEKGGEVGKVQEGGNIRVIDNSNTSVAPKPTIVSDLTGLQTAIKNGATNIVLTRTIILTDDTDIILNNKTLTLSEDFVWENNAAIYSNGHALTINGTILGCQKEMTGKNYLIKVESDGSKNLNLTNTELRANGVYGAVCVVDTKLDVNNSGIFATNAIAVNIRKKDNQINLGTVVAVDIKGDVNVTNDYNVNKSHLKVGHESTINGNLNVSGSNENGLIVVVESGVIIGEGFTGWPTPSTIEGKEVGTLEALQEALLDETVTNIVLTKSIEVSGNLNLGSKTIYLSETFFSDNQQDNAAFIITGNDVSIEGYKGSAKIVGSANIKDKYIFKSIGKNLQFNGVVIEAEDALNALYVQDAQLTTNNRTNIKSVNGYALDMISEGSSANANINNGSVVTGKVHYLLNSKENSSSFVVNNSSVTGEFSYGGEAGLNMLKITKSNGGSISGNNWPKGATGNEGSEEEGEPVATLTELTEALENPDVQKILLTAPLTIEVSETMSLNLNGKVITVDKGVWEQADAAITVKPKNTADGSSTTPYKFFNISNYSGKTCKIEGETEDNSKYLIKSSGVNVTLNSTCLQATENLNAIYVENANLDISENSNITSDKGYALNIKALINRAEVFLHNNSTINGAVHFNINYDTNEEGYYSFSGINASQGCAVNGKLTIDGEKSSAFELITEASEGSNTTPKINDIFNGEGWSDAYIAMLQRRFSMGGVGEDNAEIVLNNGETIEFRVSDKTITQMGFRIGKISGDGTIKFVNGTDQTISLSINIFDLGDNINLEFENGDKFKKKLHIYSNRVKELFGLASGGDHVRVYLKQNLTINEEFVCGTNMSRIPEEGVWGCLEIELVGHMLTINSPIQVEGGAFGIVGYEGGGTVSSGIEFIKAGAAVSGKETIHLQITPDVTINCTNTTWFGVEGTNADVNQNRTVSFDFMPPAGSSKNDKVRIGTGYELVKVDEQGVVVSGNVKL